MNWSPLGIAEAVACYKEKKNAVLGVFLYDNTDSSKTFEALLEGCTSLQDNDKFVAIKIASDSPGYTQFVQIYQLVPLPSMFFINTAGAPIEIATSILKTPEELQQLVDRVITASNSVTVPKAVVTPIQTSSSVADSSLSSEEKARIENLKAERLKRAQELVEKVRKDKIQEDAKREREREIERREAGKNVQSLKDLKADLEIKQMKEDRIKEKLMEKDARNRVLLQISQDKEERAKKFATPTTKPAAAPVITTPQPIPGASSDSVRIQFKKPDGSTHSHTFKCSDLFSDLHAYAKSSVVDDSSVNFSIVMTFPRKEFSSDDYSLTLAQLGLYPSASLLIISKVKFNAGNVLPAQPITGFLSAFMMSLYGPIAAAFAYVRNLIFNRNTSDVEAGKRKRDEEALSPNDAAKRRNLKNSPPAQKGSTGTSRKANKRVTSNSNIHRLHDNDSDSDDLNTYNGNSTEQL